MLPVLIVLLVVIHTGYAIGYIRNITVARILAWLLVAVSVVAVHFITLEITSIGRMSSLFLTPEILRMLVIITTTLFGMKGIVLVETYRGSPKLNYIQWLAFCTGWFGMRPQIFEKLVSPPLNDKWRLIIKGITRILIGLTLLFLFAFLYYILYSPPLNYKLWLLIKWPVKAIVNVFIALLYVCSHFLKIDSTKILNLMGLTGMSFILHFGILNISTGAWRFLGVDCKELFRSPGLSMSLKEFWGKRWNIAFSEMTALVLYRPLKDKLGKNAAVFVAFLFSGILHELAISVPVNAGYGLPLLYFLIHGSLMQAEDKIEFIKKINKHKIYARIWVMCWLILPIPLLFHKEFMGKIVLPIIGYIT